MIFRPDKRDIQKDRYGRISWHVSRGESLSFFPLLLLFFSFHSQQKHTKRESTQKVWVGGLYEKTGFRKWPTIIIALSFFLSLCSGNSMQSLGLAPLTFMKKVFLTAKIYSINWLQMGRAKLPRSCTKFLVTSRKAWYRGKVILSTSNFDLHL